MCSAPHSPFVYMFASDIMFLFVLAFIYGHQSMTKTHACWRGSDTTLNISVIYPQLYGLVVRITG